MSSRAACGEPRSWVITVCAPALATAELLAYFSLTPELALYPRRTQWKGPRISMKHKCLPHDSLAAEQWEGKEGALGSGRPLL